MYDFSTQTFLANGIRLNDPLYMNMKCTLQC